MAESGHLPGILRAPTGAGKTAAIVMSWLWLRRLQPNEAARSVIPRRLVYCLPMRVLVEQTARVANTWVDQIADRFGSSRPLVQALRGGCVDTDWDHQPERDAILIGTQDQLLSRALNRGYATSRFRWPMHFALLHNDAWWVFDEVQLMGPGLRTGTQLCGLRSKIGSFGPTGATWMSATLQRDWLSTPDFVSEDATEHALDRDDFEVASLQQRLHASKPLQRVPPSGPRELADWILSSGVHGRGKLTLVVVNRVDRARDLAARIAKEAPDVDLIVIHSRFRGNERRIADERLRTTVPPKGPGRIVVATQAIEAGVDISAHTLVTDLAPWPSLVQRFGRCNRGGELSEGQVAWVDLEVKNDKQAAPYSVSELDAARTRLASLENARIIDLPAVEEPWPISDVPRRRDVIELFDTDADLDGNFVDVSPFIRATGDMDVSVYWRSIPDQQPARELPAPSEDELCPVGIADFREFAKTRTGLWWWDSLEGHWVAVHQNPIRSAPGYIVAGQTYLLDSSAGGYDTTLGWSRTSKKPVAPVHGDAPRNEVLEGYAHDPLAFRERYVELAVHSRDTERELGNLIAALPGMVTPHLADKLGRAALWHDIGKTHAVFQDAAGSDPRAPGFLAKAPSFSRYKRPGFRHELVSALGALEAGLDDLTAYLVAAHHGKVRTSLRPIDWETPRDPALPESVRGVAVGDRVEGIRLNETDSSPSFQVSLDLVQLGHGTTGKSWSERVWRLVEEFGPFRLAYLETLVRVADWRSSAHPSQSIAPSPTEESTDG